jgi:hypothetical protein
MSAPNKIRATHLELTAIIYVRQSSPAQVRDNRESQARQYAVPIAQAGVATGLGTFARAAGATLGSAAFGTLLATRAGDAATLFPQTPADALHDTFLASVGALLVGAVLVMLLRVPTTRAPKPVPSTDRRQAVAEPRRGGAGEERPGWATRV